MTIRTARRLLRLAEMLCGTDVSGRIFEPLLADWSREWAEARGARRFAAACSGAGAYAGSLLRCLDLRSAAGAQPATAFVIVLAAFSGLAVMAMLLPLMVWRHWAPTTARVYWRHPEWDTLYLVPDQFAFGMVLALLPASVLAASAGWAPRKWVGACLLSLTVVVVLDGWAGPIAWQARTHQFWTRAGREVPPQAGRFPTLTEHLAMARSADPLVAHPARRELQSKARTLVNAAALALLGTAVGRARRLGHARLGPAALTGWWFGGAGALLLLTYWSRNFARAIDAPLVIGTWMPAAILLAVAAAASLASRPDAHPGGVPRRAG